MIDYQQELNPSQRDAVLYTEGDSMVIAGAGSGKTRVLTYKIAHLLEEGVEPWAILALTFTNKAAGEMKQRIAARVGENRARSIWMGTFHSIFSRILRSNAEMIGYSPSFTIYDQQDSQNLIRTIIKEMNLDEKTYRPNLIQNYISNAKNRLTTASSYWQRIDNSNEQYRKVGKIYEVYEQRCRQSNAMDFDDLLLNTFILFRDYPDVLSHYGTTFKYILVDEYQDTNYAQHCIVWQLTRHGAKVCVVGDDAQSIYSFRGANLDNMLRFSKQYPDYKLFKLEQNYRSTQTIVDAAGSLICKNHAQIPKKVFSENEQGDKIKVYRAYSEQEESAIVANNIQDMHTFKNVPLSEIAVLYRTNAQSRSIEEILRKRGLPYKVYGGLSFYQRKEVKDVIAYFRACVNPNDEESLKRIINYPPRGIGDKTIEKIRSIARGNDVSLWNVISNLTLYPLDINAGMVAKLESFKKMLDGFIQDTEIKDAQELAERIMKEAGIVDELLKDNTVEGDSRRQNVDSVLSKVAEFCAERKEAGDQRRMTDYLSEISLMTDQDNESSEDIDKITLMTIHAAKGLEFDSVFIVGLDEKIFPSEMSSENERQIEEERRLMYVAMTRARKYLLLLSSRERIKYGKSESFEPSRFLKEIDPIFLNMPSEGIKSSWNSRQSMFADEDSKPVFQRREYSSAPTFQAKKKFETEQPVRKPWQQGKFQKVTENMLKDTAPAQASALKVGNVIEHERFGIGSVLEVEGSGDNTKARIKFLNVGEKTLLLKFARYKILK